MTTYQDPASVQLDNGRTMADSLPRSRHGLRGVVVRKATAGGTPENFNPHDLSDVHINIMSQSGSKERSLALSSMTPAAVELAMKRAKAQISGDDIQSIRERTAMAFEELAKIAESNVARTQAPQVKKATAPQPVRAEHDEEALIAELQQEAQTPTVSLPPVEQIDRNYSPLAAFGLKKPTVSQTVTASPVSSAKASAPQKLVYFEKEGLGTVPAFYHDVIINVTRDDPDTPEYSGFIVLVYDLRFEQNAARWFPPSNDPYQRPWAAMIKGDQRLYLVNTTGFQYVYDNREYCILQVDRALISAAPEV